MAHAVGFAGDHGMNQRFGLLTCLAASALLAALSSDAIAAARHKQIEQGKKAGAASKTAHHRNTAHQKDKHAGHTTRRKSEPHVEATEAAETPALSGDAAAVKNAIDLVRKVKTADVIAIEKTIADPVAQKLVEWYLLRHPEGDANFSRYAAFIGAKDFSAAMRAAHRFGGEWPSIVKACEAVKGDEKKALDLLDSVATEARQDLGYALCRIHWMVRHDRLDEAARLVVAAPAETMALQDTDEWWRERRVLARKLLDQHKYETAYQVVRDAALPASESYRADFHFMTGWIAFRYLNDPAMARGHFAHIDDGSLNPIVRARAGYWRGRVAEAIGEQDEARASYEAAARHTTAYYGQLARAKLGLDKMELRTPPAADSANTQALADELVRAADMLYTVGERDLAASFVSDLAEQSGDAATLAALGELTGRRNHAHAMLEIGRIALARGLAVDPYAFPTIGIPQHNPIGPAIDRSIIYSVARTER